MDRAASEFIEAVKLGPSYDASNANLGVYYLQHAKRVNKAIECFERAARVNPYAAFHRANLAGAYLTVGRNADAEKQLREAIRLDSGSPRYQQSLAAVLLRQNKVAAAIADFARRFGCRRTTFSR